ncbi:gamma-aminobutyric acid type B receptor subunit 2-like, partial [Saccoglossus kowalevskii]|uniref:Uncharacterized protein LOC102810399 n=1 Tax=Saccoglossus kowalevskii TaxID=10224 RepID=A0ABM0MQ46_SACKO
LSYSAASSALSNREQYPTFFRTYLPDAAYNPARIRLMRDFGWTRVATIHENHDLFSLAIDNLLTLMKENNITAIKSESFSGNPKNQIENLKKDDAKIIVGNMYEDMARRVFCEAYKQDMTGPEYVWFLIGWYGPRWWEVNDPYVDCTLEELKAAVEGSQYIATESLQLSTSEELTIAGITAAEYEQELRERMEWPENQNYVWNGLAPYGYDAAWAIALMLDKAAANLKTKSLVDGTIRRLEDFTYDDKDMSQLFFDLLSQTDFRGVSGPVSFRNGDRVGVTQIEQLQASCKNDYLKWNFHCYLLHTFRMEWSQARELCQSDGGDLIVITSSQELEFVISKLGATERNKHWFVGLTFDGENYVWNNGVLLNTSIINQLPDVADSNQTCVSIDDTNSLRPVNCLQENSFVCEANQEYIEQRIALYTENGDILEYTSDFDWRGEKIPLDHTPQIIITTVERYLYILPEVYYVVCSLAALGIIMALFFLGFNVKYREQRYVKMSSPYLNNIILMGSILVYIAIFSFGLDNNWVGPEFFHILCQVRTWIISVGFVTAYGAMFSKTWRVHRVAALKTVKRRIVTDRQLYGMVLVLVMIDVTILTVWQIMDPLYRETEMLRLEDDPDVSNQQIQPILEYCACQHFTYWLGALYAYKGLLLIFGTFLAWETRTVSIPALNDSKYIGMSVYNVIILCIIGVSVSPIIHYNVNASFAFQSAIALFCTSITLLLVFVPKIVSVTKHPEGEPVSTMKTHTPSTQDATAKHVEEMVKLQKKLDEVEAKLNKSQRGTSNRQQAAGVNVDSGCGLWCFGLICGCCSANINKNKDTTEADKHAYTNDMMDSGRADSILEL